VVVASNTKDVEDTSSEDIVALATKLDSEGVINSSCDVTDDGTVKNCVNSVVIGTNVTSVIAPTTEGNSRDDTSSPIAVLTVAIVNESNRNTESEDSDGKDGVTSS
jgi:hypothetical protein